MAVSAYWAGSSLVVLRREPDGTVKKTVQEAEHCCYLRAEQATPAIRSALRSSRWVRGILEEPGGWLRVRWLTRESAKKAAEPGGWFEQQGVAVYEADVDPVRRWLTDSGAELQRPRRAYIDLESDSRVPFSRMARMRVLCWSIVSEDGAHKRSATLLEESDEAEAELLRAFWRELGAFDQVAAWNGDRFDFVLLVMASERLGVAVEERRWLWIDHLLVYAKRNIAAESGDEKQSLSLASVARAVLGEAEEKLVELGKVGGPTSWGMWEAGGEQRELLERYCLDDADKLRRIEEKTGYLELTWAVGAATHTFPDSKILNDTRYVEGFLMRLGRERGMRFPSWTPPERMPEGEAAEVWREQHKRFKGAFVLHPTKRGILRDVHVCDFARLYPSIIVSWNMGPETWLPDVVLRESARGRPPYLAHVPLKEYPRPDGTCEAPLTERCFANEPQAILAIAVLEMLRLRKFWDDRKRSFPPGTVEWKDADRRSAAYKAATNAFYGVVGSPWSRFFVREVAEAIAQTGAWLIQETIRNAESHGWRVVYGDSDSCFVIGPSRAEFQRWTDEMNRTEYPRLLAAKGCAPERCMVSLEAEKGYALLVMVAAKTYAGKYAYFKGKDATADSKPEIKGLEFRRGDSLRLARRMQEEAIKLLLADEPGAEARSVALVERWRHRILEEPFELADVLKVKGLSKSLREYGQLAKKDGTAAARPPHVEVAALLHERGRDVRAGVRIEYFVVDGSSSPMRHAPAEDWRGECDRFAIWEEVFPATMRVLEACFPGTDWKRFEKARPPKARGAPKLAPGEASLFAAKDLRQRALEAGEGKRRAASAAKAPKASGQAALFDLRAPHPEPGEET